MTARGQGQRSSQFQGQFVYTDSTIRRYLFVSFRRNRSHPFCHFHPDSHRARHHCHHHPRHSFGPYLRKIGHMELHRAMCMFSPKLNRRHTFNWKECI